MKRRTVLAGLAVLPSAVTHSTGQQSPASNPQGRDALDPLGRVHIPIGIPDSLDPLKTFIEAEGNFSPGMGTYGIYLWLFDGAARRLFAPAVDGVEVQRGLRDGFLIPWTRWAAEGVQLEAEYCEAAQPVGDSRVFIASCRIRLRNTTEAQKRVALYTALRSLGAAGGPVRKLSISGTGDALLVDGRTALVASRRGSAAGVDGNDGVGRSARAGEVPAQKEASSSDGNCSGALRFDLAIAPGATERVDLICPILPGRRAPRHRWVDKGQNAMVDIAELNPREGGVLQADPGLPWYRRLSADRLFEAALSEWTDLAGQVRIRVPDERWGEAFRAILAHTALCMNEGAPDVAVANYNVFNRDGIYVTNMLQKSGRFALAGTALDYFLQRPFNGRAYPEADNPGQILWGLGEHWQIGRDEAWLNRVYPAASALAAMIAYYRTTPGPHFVNMSSLRFGEALAPGDRQELIPGKCDGLHPEYTDAFDVAGVRAASVLARAKGDSENADRWSKLASSLRDAYHQRFGAQLPKGYGSYSVLWPCRLYPLNTGPAHEQFGKIGVQGSESWRYFPLARAHQGLLAGNRDAGHGTVGRHLDLEQMQGWYLLDEGGMSATGLWQYTNTRWTHSRERPGDNHAVAMPHSWALAELWHLMRDSLVYEDEDRLVLLAGLPADWISPKQVISFENLHTHFGRCSLELQPTQHGARLRLSGPVSPPGGFRLRLPPGKASVEVGGRTLKPDADGATVLPNGTKEANLRFL